MLASILLSAISISFILPDIYKFMRLAPYETAEYGLQISGSFKEADFLILKKQPEIEKISAVDDWGGLMAYNPKNRKQQEVSVWFVDDMNRASFLLPSNHKMLMDGEFKTGSAVVSWKIARNLKIKPGDEVEIYWGTYNMPEYKVGYKVSGILFEDAYGSKIIADYPKNKKIILEIKRKLASKNHALEESVSYFNNIFIKFRADFNTENIHDFLASKLSTTSFTTGWRADNMAYERFASMAIDRKSQQNVFIIYIIFFLAFCLYLLKKDRRTYNILFAMGASSKIFYLHYIIKLGFILLITNFIALFLIYIFFSLEFSTRFLFTNWAMLFMLFLASDVAIVLLTLIPASIYIKRKSVISLFNEEES